MRQEYRGLAVGTWPATEQQRVQLGQIFALDEELVEGRVTAIGRRLGHDDLAVTGQRQPARAIAPVVQCDAADLDIIIGSDGDLHRQLDFVIGAAEFGLVGIEADIAGRGPGADGLVAADQSAPLSRSCT